MIYQYITNWSVHLHFIPLQHLTSKIAIILILDHACLSYVSRSKPTHMKALIKAYSRYKASGVRNTITMRFSAHPTQYSIRDFTEFILEHRLRWFFYLLFLIVWHSFLLCLCFESVPVWYYLRNIILRTLHFLSRVQNKRGAPLCDTVAAV